MTQPDLNRELAERLLRKAGEDEALVNEVLDSSRVSDEVIGFHHNNIALPAELLDIDLLTPFAVEYRYQEWAGTDEALDRQEVREMIRQLHAWVAEQIGE